jgi:hypothetical protein
MKLIVPIYYNNNSLLLILVVLSVIFYSHDVDYKEIGNTDKARILEINFSKDNRIIEITGTKLAS